MTCSIVKVYNNSNNELPVCATSGAACVDLRVSSIEYKPDRIICHTGIHVELPIDYCLEIYPRSSISKTGFYIPNAPGIVDSDYRGEITVVFRHVHNLNREEFPYKIGDRCAQAKLVPITHIIWSSVNSINDLSETQRGEGGYGSTGNN